MQKAESLEGRGVQSPRGRSEKKNIIESRTRIPELQVCFAAQNFLLSCLACFLQINSQSAGCGQYHDIEKRAHTWYITATTGVDSAPKVAAR